MSAIQSYNKENASRLIEHYKSKTIGLPITPTLRNSKIYDVLKEPSGKNKYTVYAIAKYMGTDVKQSIQSVAKNLNLTLPHDVLKN